MKKMKRLSAALAAVVMMITMMSCMVVNVSAESALGGPVTIEPVELGLDVSGIALPSNCYVVSSNWNGLVTGAQVNVELGGVVYKAYIGGNAYADLAPAVAAATNDMTIYVCAGTYSSIVEVKVSNLNIYGPYAGISPNAVSDATNALDLVEPNPARPAAASSANNIGEAVLNGRIDIYQVGSYLTLDGVTIGGSGYVNLAEGAKDRYGTHLKNSIVKTSQGKLFSMGRGRNYDFVVENNRIFSAQEIVDIGGFGDITIRSNYLNTSGRAVVTHSLASASQGVPVYIENNYWENSNTIFSYDPSDLSFPSAFSVNIRGNYVNNFTGGYIVHNEYLALKSVPGLNINVVNNTFKGIKGTPFYFPYVDSVSNSTMARFLVNINENYFEIPKSVKFIDSQMNAYLNCARNYYTSPMSADRVVKYKDTSFVYCPYYKDPEMTTLVGGATIDSIELGDQFPVELNQEKKEVTIDFRGQEMDSFDLSGTIGVAEGCIWKMYKTATLGDEVEDGVVYFDGEKTVRYIAVSAADGSATTVYRFYLINDIGTEANLLSVQFNSSAVPEPEIVGTHYTYNLNSETALLNYELHVSSGATYTLWEDSQCQTTPLGDELGDYIPYKTAEGGYKVYVKIVSEDKNATQKYTLEFVRSRSENYDPGVLAVTTPEGNSAVRNARKLVYYYCDGILTNQTFDFKLTPGATYEIYFDKACTAKLSSGNKINPLSLKEGRNTFYILVEDGVNENVYTLVVENGVRSADNLITGINGTNNFTINGGKIRAASGVADSVSVSFITSCPYATVSVYANSQKTMPISYTSEPVTEGNRTVDDREFILENALPTNVYYVVCKAENGVTREYTLVMEKTFFANEFIDVAEDAWYASYVEKVRVSGLMTGSQTGKDADDNELYSFKPLDNVTRQQVAVMFCRLIGYNAGAYSDVALPFTDASQIADWAIGSVKVCYENGFMVGTSDTLFSPKASLTRQQLFHMIANVFDLNGTADLSAYSDGKDVDVWAKAGVEACVAAGIVSGSESKQLNPKGKVTRAAFATIVVQLEETIGLY